MAAKIFNDAGQATLSNIHLAFQWLLDPDGDPATVDAPDVVNASWGLTGGALGACNMEFDERHPGARHRRHRGRFRGRK